MNKATWQFDRETGEHFLSIDGDLSMKVGKSAGGDYFITCHSDSAGFGGEVDYEDSLAKAKKNAERRIVDGSYVELA